VYSIIFLSAMSFFACLLLTPLVRIGSHRYGLVDRPNTKRKLHATPTPRTGGIAIALSYLAALGLFLFSPLNGAASVNVPFALGLLPAVVVIFLVGLLDDLVGLRSWEKLVGQVIAACMAYAGGVHVLGVAGFAAAGWWALPITVAWLVACSNAFNLIDGMDGLATGVGLFAAFTTLAAALLQNNALLALATAPLVGALLAFLRYNFNPASIFLGDCGSLTVGFLLGCLGALWSAKSATLLGMTAPVIALSVPLLDTGISIARRFVRRQPIFSADRNHLHHRLLDRGLTPRQVALLLYGVCGLAAAFSLLQTLPHNRFDGLLLVIFCGVVWVGVQLVGYSEFDTARHLALTGTFRHIVNARLIVEGFERKAAAAATADDYWTITRDVSRELGCASVRMTLTGRVFEDRHDTAVNGRCCTIRIPLDDGGYVNFGYPAETSVRHAVAISSIAHILQRSLGSRRVRPDLSRTSAVASSRTTGSIPTALEGVR
jgi:UDP-GlcNAc:undecaprenyl-phosphate GlcNAc-1-phosphate transferase